MGKKRRSKTNTAFFRDILKETEGRKWRKTKDWKEPIL